MKICSGKYTGAVVSSVKSDHSPSPGSSSTQSGARAREALRSHCYMSSIQRYRAKPGPSSRPTTFQNPIGLLLKGLRAVPEQDWDEDELLDVIHWQRQILAIVCGIAWGAIPLTGLPAFLGFMALNLAVTFSWYRVQRIDEELYNGHQALLAEGFPPSISLFLLVWILTYTALQY